MTKDQKFLTKKWVAAKMVEALDLKNDDLVIEIGGGYGIISQFLKGKVIIIEKDSKLVDFLKEKFKDKIEKGEFRILKGDFLKFKLPRKRYKIIGNIPYSICGQIIRKIFNPQNPPIKAVLTFPEELAEKILQKNSKPSFLSYYIKIYSSVKKLLFIDKKLFYPSPKVNSYALEFNFDLEGLNKIGKENINDFIFFLKICFKYPHKTFRNNLKKFFDHKVIEKILADHFPQKPNIRSHEISFEDLIAIFHKLTKLTEIKKITFNIEDN